MIAPLAMRWISLGHVEGYHNFPSVIDDAEKTPEDMRATETCAHDLGREDHRGNENRASGPKTAVGWQVAYAPAKID